MTRRRIGLLATLALSFLVGLLAAEAQPAGNISRIGLLIPGSSSSFSSRIEVFQQGLRDLGWVEGQQIAMEYRYAENLDRIPDLAAELVRLPVALILAWGATSALAAQHATTTIPMVFVGVANPIGRGLVPRGGVTFESRRQLADFALQHRLPMMGSVREHAEAGSLLSYGASQAAMWRRAAHYVDRILKGTAPADLPVEQPTQFELVINLKTAQALGLTIPPTLLFQADEVIR
jgi:putative tryptophan/tyrosine transport system substrate-binding protein